MQLRIEYIHESRIKLCTASCHFPLSI